MDPDVPATDPVGSASSRPERLVVWGIPDHGFTQVESTVNQRQLASHFGILQERGRWDASVPRWEFAIHAMGRMLPAMSREHLARGAVDLGAEYLLFTDNDGVFPIDLFERLVAHQQDIVAPLAFTRNPPYLPVLYQTREGFNPDTRTPYYECRFVTKYPRNALVEVDATGFHAVLIRTSILAKMSQPWFFTSTATGEDLFFCLKAKREVGARCFVDTSIRTGHLGNSIIIDEEYVQKYWKEGLHLDVDRDYGTDVKYQYVPLGPDGEALSLPSVPVGV